MGWMIDELRMFARSHAAMKGGYGHTDDVLAFADYLESREKQDRVHRVAQIMYRHSAINAIGGPPTNPPRGVR